LGKSDSKEKSEQLHVISMINLNVVGNRRRC